MITLACAPALCTSSHHGRTASSAATQRTPCDHRCASAASSSKPRNGLRGNRCVKHLVLVGRKRSAADDEIRQRSTSLRQGAGREGATPKPCDIADLRRPVDEAVQERSTRTMPPLVDIIHARDGARRRHHRQPRRRERFAEGVRGRRLPGAENLDRLIARGFKLDYFVLFSSVTAFVGNPGQGAYVAGRGLKPRLPPQGGGPACSRARMGRHRQHRRARAQSGV